MVESVKHFQGGQSKAAAIFNKICQMGNQIGSAIFDGLSQFAELVANTIISERRKAQQEAAVLAQQKAAREREQALRDREAAVSKREQAVKEKAKPDKADPDGGADPLGDPKKDAGSEGTAGDKSAKAESSADPASATKGPASADVRYPAGASGRPGAGAATLRGDHAASGAETAASVGIPGGTGFHPEPSPPSSDKPASPLFGASPA